jgi:DUF1680 family protein
MYNGLLSGVSLDGTKFFYPNPLECAGKYQRSPWFGCACCPGNITRFMPSIPGYFYAETGDALYVNLYASSTAHIKLDSGPDVEMIQDTRYPWDGNIKMTVNPDAQAKFTVKVRIPGWARNEPVPSDLYSFQTVSTEPVTLKVNGHRTRLKLDQGYAILDRTWKPGDMIELNLPMPVRRIVANDQVQADRHRVALQRGPIVFCAEWPDNPDGKVRDLILPDEPPLIASFEPNLLNGVEVITGQANRMSKDASGAVTRTAQPFKAIPYYAWANRGQGEMTVWMKRE